MIAHFSDGNKTSPSDFTSSVDAYEVATLAGSGRDACEDGIGTTASFRRVIGVAVDAMRDAVFATDYDANKIRKIDVASGAVTTLAGSGAATSFDGLGTLAAFNGPHGIAVDQVESVYVTDNIGCRIRWIIAATVTGAVTTLAGSGVASSSDGLGTAATFDYP